MRSAATSLSSIVIAAAPLAETAVQAATAKPAMRTILVEVELGIDLAPVNG